jgi:hypothetical protein
MKAMAQAWRLSLLAAVLVHLLALAGWQMVRRRQPAPEGLRAADDTPILLQFSREEPLAQETGSIPLPPAAPLPPPNGGPLPAPTTLPGKTSGQTAAARTSQGNSAAGSRPGAPRASGRLARPRGSGTPAAPTAAPPLPPALGAGSPARLALEKALHDAKGTSAEDATEPVKETKADPRSGGAAPGPEGEGRPAGGDVAKTPAGGSALRATPADLRLWGLARTSRTSPGSLEGLPAGLAVRNLPLSQARRSGADIQHRRMVRFDDGVLLLWVEGTTVWLVRSPLP